MSGDYGDRADILKLILVVSQLAKDIINVQVRILVILIGVCCALILLIISLVAPTI